MSGDGLATDSAGNIYFVTGNGLFDVDTGGHDYGDTLMKISQAGAVLDYFTPHDQQYMSDNDIDLGSGGVLLLPDQPGAHPHEAITAGKNGTIYLVDRDNMGHYNPSNDSQIVQTIVNIFPHGNLNNGNFKAPVYWNGHLYFSADADVMKSFSLVNGLISTDADVADVHRHELPRCDAECVGQRQRQRDRVGAPTYRYRSDRRRCQGPRNPARLRRQQSRDRAVQQQPGLGIPRRLGLHGEVVVAHGRQRPGVRRIVVAADDLRAPAMTTSRTFRTIALGRMRKEEHDRGTPRIEAHG